MESGVGRFIVKEQFRQYNLFNYAVEKRDTGKWFDYMNEFDHKCDTNWVNSEDCSKQILDGMDITVNMNIADDFGIMMDWRRI